MVKFANNLKIPQETTASSLVPETAAMKKGRTFPSPAHMHSFFFFSPYSSRAGIIFNHPTLQNSSCTR